MPAPKTIDQGSARDVPLEALRGIAALVVVAWHFSLSFISWPLDAAHCDWCHTPLMAFAHGTAAVGVFFALSGYVLTRRFFETGEKRILIIGSMKRWFRLFLPVFLSVMLSWVLFHFDLYDYEKAAMASRSGWLMTFGFATKTPFTPDLWMAIKEGFTEAFVHNNGALNPILWTIHLEMMGSLIVLAFAALAINLRRLPWLVALVMGIVMTLIHNIDPAMAPFVPGCVLALYAPKRGSVKLPLGLLLILIGICFIGYRQAVGFYFMFDFNGPIDPETTVDYTSTIGALCIMIALITCEPVRNVLSGSVAKVLGRLSFPIYLVHMILICSFGSFVFLKAYDGNNYNMAVAITAAALLPVIIAVASVFAVIDIRWIAFVNRMARRVKI